jgi:hypothetical protein
VDQSACEIISNIVDLVWSCLAVGTCSWSACTLVCCNISCCKQHSYTCITNTKACVICILVTGYDSAISPTYLHVIYGFCVTLSKMRNTSCSFKCYWLLNSFRCLITDYRFIFIFICVEMDYKTHITVGCNACVGCCQVIRIPFSPVLSY